jgi:outer membrane receptor for ferric coprogen and ferric-rhodotorulic acid
MAPRPLNAQNMAASLALGLVVPAQASEAPRVEPTIVVTGERSNQVALDRVPTSIVNTPQVIIVLTSDELAKRGIANLNDALRN